MARLGGAIAFIHRFGSTLDAPLALPLRRGRPVFDNTAARGVVFHAADGLDAQAMGQWDHGDGFSVDGSVHIEAADRAGRARLPRWVARESGV